MGWTDLTFVECSILTASKMTQLQANFQAMAAGNIGAPPIAVNSLVWSGQGSGGYLDLSGDLHVTGAATLGNVLADSGYRTGAVSSLGHLHLSGDQSVSGVGSFGSMHASSGFTALGISSLNHVVANSGFASPGVSSLETLDISESIRLTGATPATPAANTLYKNNLIGARINFNGTSQAGTYAIVSNVCTVTITGHGVEVGMGVDLNFTSGTGVDGYYEVTEVVDANTFKVAIVTGNTSGNVTLNAYVRESFNISALTDNGVGDYTLSFARSFATAHYAVGGSTSGVGALAIDGGYQTSGSCRVLTRDWTTGGAVTDEENTGVLISGVQ